MNRPGQKTYPQRRRPFETWSRSGFGITEMLVTLILIGAMSTYLLPAMYRTAVLERHFQSQVDRQQRVLNLIETLHAWETQEPDFWEQTPEQMVERLQAVQPLEQLKLELNLTQLPAAGNWPVRRQIEVVLRPLEEDGNRKPVACTTWFFTTEGGNG